MPGKPQPTARALVACFSGVALTFTVGLAAVQWFNVQIRSAANEITGNASPSISLLSSMRGTLRQLEVLVDDRVDECVAGRCASDSGRIEQARRALAADWARYQRLPTFTGESERWPQVAARLRALEDGITLTLAALDAGRYPEAEQRLLAIKPGFDRLDGAVAELITFDHDEGVAVATRIETLARTGIALSIALAIACIALTAVAAMLAVRIARRYEQSLHVRALELDQFAGRVAHDIMSPLTATAGSLQIARRSATPEGKVALERGARALHRVQRLVDDLLAFARAGAEPTGNVSTEIAAVLEDVMSELRPVAVDSGVDLRIETPVPGRVGCSAGILTSIVSNLVRNAIMYTATSSVRNVCVRTVPAADARMVRLEVDDTGPGIPLTLGETVFEPFVRGPDVAQAGSGLGLATVKRFVSTHGGRIGFQSRPGAGTLFWFEMPKASAGDALGS